MTIYLVGNAAVEDDSSPLRLKSHIIKSFPGTTVIECDPAESFVPADGSIIIDTVKGLKKPRIFDSLADFESESHVSVHDYGLLLNLKLLLKLGKIRNVSILGLPQNFNPEKDINRILKLIPDIASGR
jgi:hypothetical protein